MDAQKKRNRDNVLTLERILGKQINIDFMAGMVANKTISNSSKLASFTFLTRSFFRAIAHRFQIFWISKNLGHARHMEERTFSFEDSHNKIIVPTAVFSILLSDYKEDGPGP